jgi:hypothetical protein
MIMAEEKAQNAAPQQNMTKEEQIGFHKGALHTLSKEREEMGKILSIVEQLMQMHVGELKKLGVDLVAMANQNQSSQKKGQSAKPTDRLDKMLR